MAEQLLLSVYAENLVRRRPGRELGVGTRYAVTTVLVVICVLISTELHRFGEIWISCVVLPAVLIPSAFFNNATGFYAVALSTGLMYFAMKLPGMLIPAPALAIALAVYAMVALVTAFIGEGLRLAFERADNAERAKDVLLHELNHRTRNNLTIVSALLRFQARESHNAEVRQALEMAVARVHAVANAHDFFHSSKQDGVIEMQSFLGELCERLANVSRDVRPIVVRTFAEDIELPAEQAIPIGLIINELVTNAMKYAFPDQASGTVNVSLRRGASIEVTVQDDGVGYPAGRPDGMGTRLIQLLAGQIGATLQRKNANPGCCVRLVIPDPAQRQ